jgi:hypothetical protein
MVFYNSMKVKSTALEDTTTERNEYIRGERRYTWVCALSLGALAVDATFTIERSINTVVANIGQHYNPLPIDLTLGSSMGILLVSGVYNGLKALSNSRRVASLDGIIAQHQMQAVQPSLSEEAKLL